MKFDKQDDGSYVVAAEDGERLGTARKDGSSWAWEATSGASGKAKTRGAAGAALAAARGEEGEESIDDLLAPPADPEKLRKPEVAPDPDVMDSLAGAYSVKLPKKVGSKVRRLREAIAKRLREIDKDDWIRCEDCHELSTEDVDRCPFCGSVGLPPGELADAPEVDEAETDAETDAEVVDAEETALVEARLDLDQRVERITTLKRDIAGKGWDLGKELFAIHSAELWKVRGHASFKAFVQDDLNMGKGLAYGLMNAATQFSREDFLAVGQSKIVLIAKLPADQQQQALDAARNGDASYRDLKEQAKEANRGHELGGPGGGKRPKREPEEPEDEPEDEEELEEEPEDEEGFTLLARVDEEPVTVPWRKETTGRKIKMHPRIGLLEGLSEDDPDAYAELDLPEAGVVVRVALAFDEDDYPVGVTFQFVEA